MIDFLLEKKAAVREDIKLSAQSLLGPLLKRPRFLFICQGNSCRSQMAAAFTRYLAGDQIEALSAGTHPAADINPAMVQAMEEKKIDAAFLAPQGVETALRHGTPDRVIIMGPDVPPPDIRDVQLEKWQVDDPFGRSLDVMRRVRDKIETEIRKHI